jgi:hypothetical protein
LNLETDRFGSWAFDGNLNIANKTFSQLNVKIPTSMFGRNNDLARFVGDSISLPFAGPINRPSIAPDFANKFVQQNLLKNPGNLLDGILNPNKEREAQPARGRQPENPRQREAAPDNRRSRSSDPLNDLLEDFADQFTPSNDRRASDEANARPAGSRQRRPANNEDIGNQRISGDRDPPPPARSRRSNRNTNADRPTGDEKISSDPKDPNR